jgi:hypothetical protein
MIIQQLTWQAVGPMNSKTENLEASASKWFNNYFNSGYLCDYLNTILNGQNQKFAVINIPSPYGVIKFEVEPWPIDKYSLKLNFSNNQSASPKFKR